MQLLEENIVSKLFDISLSKVFLVLSPQARETKAKINKWNLMKLKSFCTIKETINKMKKSTEWEKIFANDMTSKRLKSQIQKQLI